MSANTETVEKTQPYLFPASLQITGQTYSLAFKIKSCWRYTTCDRHRYRFRLVFFGKQVICGRSHVDLDEDSQVESFLYSKSMTLLRLIVILKRHKYFLKKLVKSIGLPDQQAIIEKTPPLLFLESKDPGARWISLFLENHTVTAIDLLKMISEMSGVRFEFVNGFSWAELTGKFQEGSIDGLHSIQNYASNGVGFIH